jgi:hypothetical protein
VHCTNALLIKNVKYSIDRMNFYLCRGISHVGIIQALHDAGSCIFAKVIGGFLHLFAAEKNCFTPLVAKRFHPLFDI